MSSNLLQHHSVLLSIVSYNYVIFKREPCLLFLNSNNADDTRSPERGYQCIKNKRTDVHRHYAELESDGLFTPTDE